MYEHTAYDEEKDRLVWQLQEHEHHHALLRDAQRVRWDAGSQRWIMDARWDREAAISQFVLASLIDLVDPIEDEGGMRW